MMSLNRYRLKHLVRKGHKGAIKANELLKQPDKLIGVILIGNNFVNLLAASLATIIASHYFGEIGPAIATAVLTIVVLIFAEVTPKTIAAIYPEKVAFPFAYILKPIQVLLSPVVWLVNTITRALLKLLRIDIENTQQEYLSREELRTVVHESGGLIPRHRQGMLLNILDLEKVTVNDIIVPRNEVTGIDIEDDLTTIVEQLSASQHTRLPVYKEELNNVIGILHTRNAARFLTNKELSKAHILQETREPYFVPESTPLHTQLFNFQHQKRRMALVVDEYGDVQGIVTLEDILEEIVGEFTTDMWSSSLDIHPQEDGSFYIDGMATIREVNRALNWSLPTDGPKTLNGLILEHLESIPSASVGIKIHNYLVEIIQIKDNQIKTAKITSTEEENPASPPPTETK